MEIKDPKDSMIIGCSNCGKSFITSALLRRLEHVQYDRLLCDECYESKSTCEEEE